MERDIYTVIYSTHYSTLFDTVGLSFSQFSSKFCYNNYMHVLSTFNTFDKYLCFPFFAIEPSY